MNEEQYDEWMDVIDGWEFTVTKDVLQRSYSEGMRYKTGGDYTFWGGEGVLLHYMTKWDFHARIPQVSDLTYMDITSYDMMYHITRDDGDMVHCIPQGIKIRFSYSVQKWLAKFPNPHRFPYNKVIQEDIDNMDETIFVITDGMLMIKKG